MSSKQQMVRLNIAVPTLLSTAATVLYLSFFVSGWFAIHLSSRKNYKPPTSWGQGQIVLVTGGNAGIGKLTVASLAAAGATVILACRNVDKGNLAKTSLGLTPEAAARVIVMNLDLGSLRSIKAFVESFTERFSQLDVLVLNAGIAKTFLGNSGFSYTSDGFEEMVGVNFLGHFLLTNLLLPLLRRTTGARVVGLTSVAMANSYSTGISFSSWTGKHVDFQDWKQYGQSKLAMCLFIRELQRREPSLLCLACHPGVVAETTLMHPGQSFNLMEKMYALFVFKVLAMAPKHSHLNTIFLATAPAEDLEGGACYQPVGRKLRWMSHWLQRLGALQLPVPVVTRHPRLWNEAVRLINEKGAEMNQGTPLISET